MARYFIAEGDLVIERAIEHGHVLESLLIAATRTKPLPAVIPDSVVLRGDSDVLTEVTGRPELRDPIGCFVRPPLPHATEVLDGLPKTATIAVLENVNNPNNLGVIMRNAAALGVDAVLLDPTCGDPLYRRAVRSSMGQVFALPHAQLGALPDDLEVLHDAGFETLALTPAGSAELRDVARPDRVAVLLGAEGPGLTNDTIDSATHQVRISMTRSVDSLNIANAAAIAFHHLAG